MKKAKIFSSTGRKSKRVWWTIGLACLALTSALAASNALQDSTTTVSMSPEVKTVYLRLNAAQPSLKQKIVVPRGMDALNIVLGTDPDIKLILWTPRGDIFPIDHPENFGGTGSLTTADNGTIHRQITINQPDTGVYTLELSTITPRVPNSLAVLEYTTDSKPTPEAPLPPSSTLYINYEQIEGKPIVITLISNAAGLPLASEATVDIVNNLADGTQHTTTVKLYDGGNKANGDVKVGDGVYSAILPELPPTSYMAFSKLSALVGAEKLELNGSTMFVVYKKTSWITPKIVEESAQDDNRDGLIDRLMFVVPIEAVWHEGPSYVSAVLQGSNGRMASVHSDRTHFNTNMRSVIMSVTADEIRNNIGVDGPYKIIHFMNQWVPLTPNARYDDIGNHTVQNIGDAGYTRAYSLKDFAHSYLGDMRFISDRGIDTNGNGLFDQIGITVSIDSAVHFDDLLLWNILGKLKSIGEKSIKNNYLYNNKLRIKLVKGVNQFEMIFDAKELGLNNIGGPFSVGVFGATPLDHIDTPSEGIIEGSEKVDYIDKILGITKDYTGKLEGSVPTRKVGGGITSSATITATRTQTLLAGATLTPNDPSVATPDVPALAAKAAGICTNTVSTVPSIIATPAQFDQLFGSSNCAVITGNLVVNQGVLLKNKRLILDANSSVTFNGTLTLKDSVIVAGSIAIKGVLNAENSKLYALNPMGSFTLSAGSSLFGISTIASAGGINNVGSFSASSTAFADVAFIAGKSILSNSIKGKAIFWSGGPMIVSGDIDLIGALYAKGMINISGNTKITLERRSLNGDLPLE